AQAFIRKSTVSTMASFRNIYTSLMLVIAGSTSKELARQVSYLKAENQILRSRLPERIILTHREKNRLVRFAKNLGSALNELATIVHPSTIRRWIRDASDKVAKTRKNVGRPRTAEQIEKLILKLAKDNSWGYTRILGELKKLGIESVTRNTVKNILKRNGYDVGPKRGPGTWDEFIKRHAKTMWQCDFYSKKVVSKTGLRDLFVLVFLHLETRRVFITPASYHPDEAWVLEQAEAFKQHVKEEKLSCKLLMHDRDTKFTKTFDEAFSGGKRDVKVSAFRSPNTNAYVERFSQTLQQECLDHFVVFGKSHFDHLCSEYREHYHTERPHQSLENIVLPTAKAKRTKKSKMQSTETAMIPLSSISCKERLGGLLKHYSRKAA
ncbi:MAG: integrase core domain-containing protein, partial [Pirellula sp.]